MTTIIDCHPATMNPELQAIKARQQVAWASGDYAIVGATLQIVGEQLAESMNLLPGQKVLDIAAGNGNFTLAAARRWCSVTSTDYVDKLLARGRRRAEAEGFLIEFQKADAEDLPFADRSFDAVASTFGVMFSPDQSRAAAEMIRVCRSGGQIGLASWTPEGFIGQMFKTIGKHLPPPAGLKSPALWGTRDWIEKVFGPEASSVKSELRAFAFRYRTPQHFLDVFRTYYGPMLKAFEALDAPGREALARDLVALIARFNEATDGTVRVYGEYLEVAITRR